jgi:hypothetical protein
MFTAKQFRAKAAESAESLKHTDVPSEIRELQRSRQSFSALAENEDWLANNFDRLLRSSAPGLMKFVILFLPRTEIRAIRATASRVSPKNMNGSRLKATSRFRSAFSPEARDA